MVVGQIVKVAEEYKNTCAYYAGYNDAVSEYEKYQGEFTIKEIDENAIKIKNEANEIWIHIQHLNPTGFKELFNGFKTGSDQNDME